MNNRWSRAMLVAAVLGAAACGDGSGPLGSADQGAPAAVASLAAVVEVAVADDYYSPDPVPAAQGSLVHWSFEGPSQHSATDDTGMALYDSGIQDPGGSASFTFFGAGVYRVRCRAHDGMEGSVAVPLKVAPATGGTGTTFRVTWSSATAPAGYVFDVQIRRPGSLAFVNWKVGKTTKSATFVADAGTGIYKFRSLLRKTADGTKSQYSAAKKITVS